MKRQMTLRSLLAITCLLLGLSLHAQTVTIHVATAGTLSSYIASNEKDQITSLTLTGDLNGTDIRYIREMAGINMYGSVTSRKLSILDISGANIVAGGDYYSSSLYSSDNTIGGYMFYGTQLTSISIPNSVTSIGNSAFKACSELASVSIPNSVTSISAWAFYYCSGLTSITIPNSVTSIGDEAFYRCSRLTSVLIPNSVTSIGNGVFYSCSGLTSVTIPNSVTSVGSSAFSGCTGLSSVTIGNNITSIGGHAFYCCSRLSSVTIPNSVTSIGDNAFEGCRGLTEIHSRSAIPPTVGSNSFGSINKIACKLYVPKGSFLNYWVPIWGDFANIIEEDITSLTQMQSDNIKIYTEAESVVIEGVEPGETISTYTESGALVQPILATGDILRINVPSGHTYLIKTAGKTFKIAL